MRRLLLHKIALGFIVGVVAAVAFLPFTSWTFKNHLEFVTGGYEAARHGEPLPLTPVAQMMRATPNNARRVIRNSQLQYFDWRNDLRMIVQSQRVADFDKVELAHVLRHMPGELRDVPYHYESGPAQGRDLRAWLTEAAVKGTQLDPDNAFFWTSLAVLHRSGGRVGEAEAAVERAARCSVWQDYAVEESKANYDELLLANGYRGEPARILSASSTSLGSLADFGRFAVAVSLQRPTPHNLRLRLEFLELGRLLMSQGMYPIHVMQGADLVAIAVDPDFARTYHDPKRVENGFKIEPFQNQLRVAGIGSEVDLAALRQDRARIFKASAELYSEPPQHDFMHLYIAQSLPPAFLIATVFALALPLLGYALSQRIKLEKLRFFTAHLLALFAFEVWLNETTSGLLGINRPARIVEGYEWIETALFFLAFLSIFRWTQLAATITGVGLMLWGTWMEVAPPQLLAYAPVLLGVLFFTRGEPRVWHKSLRVLAVLLAAGILGAFWGLEIVHDKGAAQVFSLFLILVATVCFARVKRLIVVAPVVAAVFAAGYLGAVVNEVISNQGLKGVVADWYASGDLLRDRAGIANSVRGASPDPGGGGP
jgi:hypothetical protein